MLFHVHSIEQPELERGQVFRAGQTEHQRPYQPKAGCIIQQQLASKTLSFQDRWYKNHTWLHYCPDVRGILCFYCMKAFRNQTSPLAKSVDQSFVSTGFQNWKKAIETFKAHEMSQEHKVAITTHTSGKINRHTVIISKGSSATAGKVSSAKNC